MTYAELLQIQKEDLLKWSTKLLPPVLAAVTAHVLAANCEFVPGPRTGSMYPHPTKAGMSMRVWRGMDLCYIISDWPEVRDSYVIPKEDDCI